MDISFREKSSWISLLTIVLIFGYYFYHAFQAINGSEVANSGLGLFIGAVIMVIIVQIVSHIVLAILSRKEAELSADEREKLVELKAGRNAHFFLVFGVFITAASMLVSTSLAVVANTLIFFFILSELVRFSSQIYFYRKGY